MSLIPGDKVGVEIVKTAKPYLKRLLGGASEQLGDFLTGITAPVGFGGRRLIRLFGKLDEHFDQKALVLPTDLPQERLDRVQRTIFFAAQSVGEDLLEYWAAIIAYQATTADDKLDYSESIVSALREMTDAHGRFLRAFADKLEFQAADDVHNAEKLRNVGLGANGLTIDDFDADSTEILAVDLLRFGLLYSQAHGFGHGIRFLYLSRVGAELLTLGGWQPKLRPPVDGVKVHRLNGSA